MERIKLHEKKIYEGCEKACLDISDYAPGRYLRPAVLVIPGGAYEFVAPIEGIPVADAFAGRGFGTFILSHYAVAPECHEINPLLDAASAIVYIRNNAEKFGIDKNKIAVCGFSAGGHLAAYISNCYNDNRVLDILGIGENDARPDASILSYPVITAFEGAHIGSIKNLLSDANPSEEAKVKVSLEKRVTENTPPSFIWATADDGCVPVWNSLTYANSLAKHNVPCELHVFPKGSHGLSVANRSVASIDDNFYCERPYVARWVDLAAKWLNSTFYENEYRL